MDQKKKEDRNYIGMDIEAAKKLNPKIRVTRQDGQPLIVTMDYDPMRPNVEVIAGKITKVLSFG